MNLHEANRILVCLRYGIGDVVMETPVLETLRTIAPHAHITALGAAPAAELMDDDPRVDERVSTARWGLRHRWDTGTEEARRALDAWAAALDYDVYLDVHHATDAVAQAIWARGIQSLEADEAVEEAAVSGGANAVGAIKASVRAGWGVTVPDDLRPRLHLGPLDRARAERFLAGHGIDGEAPVAVSPVASLPMKRWPAERLARTADRMIEETGRPLLLFCGPQEEAGTAVLSAMRHADAATRVGALHLRRVAALLSRCAVFVGNDTGLLHMAAAVDTPTVGVFGPTSPEVYLPPGAHVIGLGGREINCPHRNTGSLHPPGCWTSERCLIADRSCIWQVDADAVAEAALERVSRRETSPRTLSASA